MKIHDHTFYFDGYALYIKADAVINSPAYVEPITADQIIDEFRRYFPGLYAERVDSTHMMLKSKSDLGNRQGVWFAQMADRTGAVLMLPGAQDHGYDSPIKQYRTTSDVVRGADSACKSHPWGGPVAVPVHSFYVVLPYKADAFDYDEASRADKAAFTDLHDATPDEVLSAL